jgi:GT2 family glycosyltransferase
VQKALRSLKAEIIVVDNASADGSIKYLLSKFPGVNFIDNPKNVGFARANNQALREAKGEYILFLNPDTILPEDCLDQCLELFQLNPKIGACGVKMIDGSGSFLPESKRAFPSLQTSFYKLSGLTSLFPHSRRFARYHLGHLPDAENAEIDVLSGAFFMTKREVLHKTGAFDERFFMYGEDIDLSFRIQQSGYVNFYLAETSIIHFKGESTKKGSIDYVRMFYKAMSLFFEKHYRSKNPKALAFLIETSIWFRAGLSATKNFFAIKMPVPKEGGFKTLVVASETATKEVAALLKKQSQERKLYYVKPGADLNEAVVTHAADEIILVQGALSYKEIISAMQQLPPGMIIYIYADGAGSIISSSSKNTNGFILALP